MSTPRDVRAEVRAFYEEVGWQEIGEGLYQNARYEDLRPVAREYIRRCHLRLGRHLPAQGKRLLDAGSGPIQYPEYLEYSRGYGERVCLDLSRRALLEARRRIGAHGRFVVGDIAALPFVGGAFDGLVSLHTLHHLPGGEQPRAVAEMVRVLAPGGRGVAVYSWGDHSPLMRWMRWPIGVAFGILRLLRRLRLVRSANPTLAGEGGQAAAGTFTCQVPYRELRKALEFVPGLDFVVWRSVSTSFLRAFIHRRLGGAIWLRLLYALEGLFPRVLGRLGQYAMIVFHRPALGSPGYEGTS